MKVFGLTMYESMMHRKGSKIIFFMTAGIFSSLVETNSSFLLGLVEKVFL